MSTPQMTDAERLLARYLMQMAELGGDEIYLDTMTPAEALAGLRARIAGNAPAAQGGSISAEPSSLYATSSGAPKSSATPASPMAAFREALRSTNDDAVADHTVSGRSAASVATGIPDGPLPILAQRASVCTLCRLWEGRTNAVFGEGDANADLIVVGEAPGEDEDRTGRPFVGRAGKLLDLMLMTAGFPREKVYICNVLKCRPPGNRNPMPDEAVTCTTNYLFAQLDAIAPRAILAVGKFAAQALLNTEQSISRLRGTTHTYRGTPLIVTYHPAYLLRSPQMARVAWEDYQLVRKVLDGEV
jgi:DNA polymerase